MKILDRLSSSLFSFKSLSNAANDRKLLTFGYVLILLLILIVPNIVYSTNILELNYDTKVAIRNIFRNDKDLNFRIEDGQMINYGTEEYYYKDTSLGFGIYISGEEEVADNVEASSQIAIILLKEKAYLSTGMMKQELFTYADNESLMNIDFSGASTDDAIFWDLAFNAIQGYFDAIKPAFIAVYILIALGEGLVTILVCALVLTLFNRFGSRTTLDFGDHYKLSIYSSTGYVVGNTLAVMFDFGLFYYIGLIISIACCIISGSKFNRIGEKNEL